MEAIVTVVFGCNSPEKGTGLQFPQQIMQEGEPASWGRGDETFCAGGCQLSTTVKRWLSHALWILSLLFLFLRVFTAAFLESLFQAPLRGPVSSKGETDAGWT